MRIFFYSKWAATAVAILILFGGTASAETVTYKVITSTTWNSALPYRTGAGNTGTDGNVEIKIHGTKGTTTGHLTIDPKTLGLNERKTTSTHTLETNWHTQICPGTTDSKVGDVGRALQVELSLAPGNSDDWHHGPVTIVRQVDGVDADHSAFSYEGWVTTDNPETLLVDELKGKKVSLGSPSEIILDDSWIVLNNLNDPGRPENPDLDNGTELSETISIGLDEEMWTSKTNSSSSSASITVGASCDIMGSSLSTEISATTEAGSESGRGQGKSSSRASEVTVSQMVAPRTLLLTHANWVVKQRTRTLGSFVSIVPVPGSLKLGAQERFVYESDPDRPGSLRQKVNGQPISTEHLAVIKRRIPNLLVPTIAMTTPPASESEPVSSSQNFADNLTGSRWSYVWQGSEFQFTFGQGTIDDFTNGYWPGVIWQPKGENQVLLINKPRSGQEHLPPGAAYVNKTMYLNFNSANSFTGVDWNGSTSITGKRLR